MTFAFVSQENIYELSELNIFLIFQTIYGVQGVQEYLSKSDILPSLHFKGLLEITLTVRLTVII